jgi:hypothetical protein
VGHNGQPLQVAPRLDIRSVAEWATQSFDREGDCLIENDILDKGFAMLVVGPPKAHKSFFTNQLAMCVAAGNDFIGFGTSDVPRKVLILQAELPPSRMMERFLKQMKAFDPAVAERVLACHTASRFRLDDPSCEQIRSAVNEHKPDLLIVDPLRNFHSSEENSSTEMGKVLAVLDDIRDNGPAVVLVHHSGKNSKQPRGSTVLPGWYDSQLQLSLPTGPERNLQTVSFDLRHGVPTPALQLRFKAETFLFERLASMRSMTESENAMERNIGQVLQALDKGPGDAKDIARRCGNTRSWANQPLNEAVRQGRAVKRKEGRAWIYSLPEATCQAPPYAEAA